MRKAGLRGCPRGRRKRTTRRDKHAAPAPDLVKRNFCAIAPDKLKHTHQIDLRSKTSSDRMELPRDHPPKEVSPSAMVLPYPIRYQRCDALSRSHSEDQPRSSCQRHPKEADPVSLRVSSCLPHSRKTPGSSS